jgi:hypothetical protein
MPSSILSLGKFNQLGVVGSSGDILSSNIQGTIRSISSGANLKFGGSNSPGVDPVRFGVWNLQGSDTPVNYSNEGRGNPAAADNNPNYSNEGRNNMTTYSDSASNAIDTSSRG